MFIFFRGKGKTPQIPPEARITDDEDEDDDVEADETDEEEELIKSSGRTNGKPKEKVPTRKLCTVQRVEHNRKDIVKAGRKLKTLREIKAEKK